MKLVLLLAVRMAEMTVDCWAVKMVVYLVVLLAVYLVECSVVYWADRME